jgi:ADP-ribose pyrophosphatase
MYSNEKLIHKGRRIDLLTFEEEGHKREVVIHPGAAVILPLLDEDTVVLIANYRCCIKKTIWELPAGTLEKGEEPLTCAARELEEETGYTAASLEPLLHFYSTPGFSNEILYVFLAKELTKTAQRLDASEKIEVKVVKLKAALDMIRDGTINDVKTIASLLYYCQFK